LDGFRWVVQRNLIVLLDQKCPFFFVCFASQTSQSFQKVKENHSPEVDSGLGA